MATRLSLGDERLGRDDLGRPHEHHRRHLTVDHGPPHRPAQSQSQSQSQSKQRPYRLALIVADAYRRSQSRSDFDNHSLRSPLTLSLNPSAHRHHGRAGCGWLPWPPSPSTSLYYIQVPEGGLGKVPTPNPAIRQPRPAFAIDLDDAPTEKMLHSGRTRFQTASTTPREETRQRDDQPSLGRALPVPRLEGVHGMSRSTTPGARLRASSCEHATAAERRATRSDRSDTPGVGPGRLFSRCGRAWPSGAERGRMGPNGAERGRTCDVGRILRPGGGTETHESAGRSRSPPRLLEEGPPRS
ncbi:hypothetical protein B2J93_7401 [Marssonina coronariae]|uniref:Uncharacterized protein n=1 Tax=Diplocarpon coronariae TaxID=2795749 RepID=A0A218Z772_9HELO|nr:hypothetical protein B2J93_7401 [Marssonina coronariae]